VSCRKVCEEGLPKVKLEQEGGESWEGSAKKVAEGSNASRKYVACVELNWRLRLLSGTRGLTRRASELEAARVLVCRWSELEMMASKENAVASLGKVDPSPLLQHFSTFSLRMYCSVVYWHGAGIQKQATFLNVGKPKSMRDLRGGYCKVASFSRSVCTQSSEDGL